MFQGLGSAIAQIDEFTSKHSIEASIKRHSVGNLRNPSKQQSAHWAIFEKNPGVYCMIDESGNQELYVGTSMRDAGTRVFQWLFPGGRKGTIADSRFGDKDIVLTIVLQPDQYYMAPALESFLINEWHPTKYNSRP